MPNDPKTIMVFLDASPPGKRRAAHAITLARRWGAHLVGVYVVFAGVVLPAYMCNARGSDAIAEVIAFEQQLNVDAAAATVLMSEHFLALCVASNVSGEFRPIDRGNAAEEAIHSSLHSDLVVVGHPEPYGLPDYMSPEKILLASGAPLLILPNAWEGETIGDKVLIAWNASPEARRAVSDAMAFLVAARSVRVLVIDPAESGRHGEEPGADIAMHLIRHGAHVEVEQMASRGSPIAQVILSYAVHTARDLLVVGAYSHARLRELLFGGTTRTLLAKMPVPVLVSR
jgi:nucleotide-binding universal stress UspA family protein